MNKATLNYVINVGNKEKILRLETEPLYSMDRHTSPYRDEKDFIAHYYNKDKILNFIRDNGNVEGHLAITYAKSVVSKEEIPILFNIKEDLVFEDDPYEGKITEVEKARKLLFNSKNQLFTRLVLSLGILSEFLNKLIDLTEKEASFVRKQGINIINYNDKFYIRFRDLFKYRLKTRKLGYLRLVYEDMLAEIKREITELDDNDFYYYSRQMKYAMTRYNGLIGELSVKNLKLRRMKNTSYRLIKKNRYLGY
ncbi:MAG: hypothetical protein IKO78_05735 [Bacilli bacterium]|nr:hypothetical protein [Bacilli bacterium]